MQIEVETIGAAKGWIAEITGLDTKFGLARQFVGDRDYSGANKPRTRGVMTVAELEEGHLYEVNEPTSWKNTDRYFCTVRDGEKVRLSKEEVRAELESRHAPTVDTKGKEAVARSEAETQVRALLDQVPAIVSEARARVETERARKLDKAADFDFLLAIPVAEIEQALRETIAVTIGSDAENLNRFTSDQPSDFMRVVSTFLLGGKTSFVERAASLSRENLSQTALRYMVGRFTAVRDEREKELDREHQQQFETALDSVDPETLIDEPNEYAHLAVPGFPDLSINSCLFTDGVRLIVAGTRIARGERFICWGEQTDAARRLAERLNQAWRINKKGNIVRNEASLLSPR